MPSGFAVPAESYDRFMGRYSRLLAPVFADFAGVVAGMRVLDVGCGPGALTTELVARVGAANVVAIEPSEPFAAAARAGHPGVHVEQAPAERIPFGVDEFGAALAQLVVHFFADPAAGLREMARVTRPGGVVAACVWDHAGGRTPIGVFWAAARELDPTVEGEWHLAGAREGHLVELFEAAGLRDVEGSVLEVALGHPSFEDWWEPLTLGVGPAGTYTSALDERSRDALRDRCRELLGPEPLTVNGQVWAARGLA